MRVLYIGNNMYATTTDEYLIHYGRKGMKWGRHIYGDDDVSLPRTKRKKKKKSLQQRVNDFDRRQLDKAEASRYGGGIEAEININGKKKKLPKSPIGMLFKYKDLSDEEYNEAMKGIRKRNEVYDGAINEAYRAERALNYPNVILKDVTTAMRNVDYLRDKFGDNAAKRSAIREAAAAAERKNIVNPSAGETLDFFDETGFKRPSASELKQMQKDLKNRDAMHSDILKKGNYLEHYGVKGMKWGVRHDRKKTGSTGYKKHTDIHSTKELTSEKSKGMNVTRFKIGNTAYNIPTKWDPRIENVNEYVNSIRNATKWREESRLGNIKYNTIKGKAFLNPNERKRTAYGALRLESYRDPGGANASFIGRIGRNSSSNIDRLPMINRHYDKNGKCALVTAYHPEFGNMAIRGTMGNIKDIDPNIIKNYKNLGY